MPLLTLAHDFSPRVERAGDGSVIIDASGLTRLIGDARAIGEAIVTLARARSLDVRVGVAATRTAACLAAETTSRVTVIAPGDERRALATLPLKAMHHGASGLLERWGLRTLGDLAALPAADLFERLGETGLWLQRIARGADDRPLVPEREEAPYEASLALEWPVETLEPLSFILARLLDPLADRLGRAGAGAVALEVRLRLTTRDVDRRRFELPAPMRDPRVLRTLILLDLEARRPGAGIDEVIVRLEPARSRVVQGSLVERPLPPPERIATLVARLTALVGEGRSGAAALVDSHAPDAIRMERFNPGARGQGPEARGGRLEARGQRLDGGLLQPPASSLQPLMFAFRRFRPPRPIRTRAIDGRPVHVSFGVQASGGGRVETCAGPWRTSGQFPHSPNSPQFPQSPYSAQFWDREEWDVALTDGAVYRLFRDRVRDQWFVEGMLD